MSSKKVVVVLGASGTIGVGFIKACLDSSHDIKVVGVFRSDDSALKTAALLSNPPEDKFVTVVGNVASEESATELLKLIQSKAGEVTDVIASIGGWGPKPLFLDQTFENLEKDVVTNKLKPFFHASKAFVPYLSDKPNTTFTNINGGLANMVAPNLGNMTVANGVLAKMAQVLMFEYKDKPLRLNEFMIACHVTQWDNIAPGSVSNVEMGRALLGVVTKPAAKSVSMLVTADNMETIAKDGIIVS